MEHSMGSSIKDLFDQWTPPLKGKFFKKVWMFSFFIILWTIWKERNSRIFQGKPSFISELKELILLRMGWWIKGWSDPFPYNAEDIVQNPLCLKWSAPSIIPKPILAAATSQQWTPPCSRSLKWNVDASIKKSQLLSSIGGILRDHNDKFICMFSSPIPFMQINKAQVLAIHRALKISAASPQIRSSYLIIESDSSNAVSWCCKEASGP